MDSETKDNAMEGGLGFVDGLELLGGEIPVLGSIAHAGLAGKAYIDSLTTSDPAAAQRARDEAKFQMVETVPGGGPLMGTAREQQVRAAIKAGDDPLPGPGYTESGPNMQLEMQEAKDAVEIARSHGQAPDPKDLARLRQLQRETGDPEGRIVDGKPRNHDGADLEAMYEMQQYRYQMELNDQTKNGSRTPDGHAKPLDRPDMTKVSDDLDSPLGMVAAKTYEVAAPWVHMFTGGAPDDDAMRRQEEELHEFHYSK